MKIGSPTTPWENQILRVAVMAGGGAVQAPAVCSVEGAEHCGAFTAPTGSEDSSAFAEDWLLLLPLPFIFLLAALAAFAFACLASASMSAACSSILITSLNGSPCPRA